MKYRELTVWITLEMALILLALTSAFPAYAGIGLDARESTKFSSFDNTITDVKISATTTNGPVLEGLTDSVNVNEGDLPVIIDQDVTLTDPESVGFDAGQLTVAYSVGDQIALKTNAPSHFTISGSDISYDGTLVGSITTLTDSNAVVTFSTGATRQIVEEMIEYTTYTNTTGDPQGTHPIIIAVTDSQGRSTGDKTVSVIVVSQDQPPVVGNPSASNITASSATLGATVQSDGNAAVIARGIVWSTSPGPTLDSHLGSALAPTAGTGLFTVSVTGLDPQTTYYYRGYAQNSAGIGYSQDGQFTTIGSYDYGDAPSPYPASSHLIVSNNIFLGTQVDAESASQPDAGAAGDDNHGVDDEDGVTFTTQILSPGSTCHGNVVASAGGFLNAWIDFNGDGDWNDSSEHIIIDYYLQAGNTPIVFVAPQNIGVGTTYARFRFSSQSVPSPEGPAGDGEVEDYALTLIEENDDPGDVLTDVTVSATEINEGNVISLNGNVTDEGTMVIDWGDSTSPQTSEIAIGSFTFMHLFADGPINNCTIALTFTDTASQDHTELKVIKVNDVEPAISVGGSPNGDKGTPYTITLGAVADPGADTVSEYIVNWDDGNSDSFTSTGEKTHTYATAGGYSITVDLKDEDGWHSGVGRHNVMVFDAGNPVASVTPVDTTPTPSPTPTTGNTGDNGYGSGTESAGNGNGGSDDNNTSDDGDTDSGGGTGGGATSKTNLSSNPSVVSGHMPQSKPASSDEDSGDGGIPIWLIVVPIIAAIVVGIGVYYLLGTVYEWW